MAQEELENELEDMIDKTSFYDVVHALEHISYGKAIHLSENWQDDKAAGVMERLGGMFDKVGEFCQRFTPQL